MVDCLGAEDVAVAGVEVVVVVEGVVVAPETHEHSVTPPAQHLQPCLYPVQHSQLRHSGNQNSAAAFVSLPLMDGIAP